METLPQRCRPTQTAIVGHREFDTPTWVAEGLPTNGTPATSPVAGGDQLDVWGDHEHPRQWWIRLGGTSRQLIQAGIVTASTPGGVSIPNAVHTRARIDLRDGLVIEHDWRGTILTPPTRGFSISMLGRRDPRSARLDKGGELAGPAGADAVTIESLFASTWEASSDDIELHQRQSRGRQIARVVDVYDFNSAQNFSVLWIPLQPWCQRFRFRAFRLSGGGSLSLSLLAHVTATSAITMVIDPPALDAETPWIDAMGSIALRPVIAGGGISSFRVQIEQEVDV